MYPIGNGLDGHLFRVNARPQELPHPARDRAMKCAYAVVLSRQAQCQHRHTKGRTPSVILAGYLHKLLTGQSKLAPVRAKILINQVVTKCIVARRDRRMGSEK